MFRRIFYGWRNRKDQWTSSLVSSSQRLDKSWMMSSSLMNLVNIFFPHQFFSSPQPFKSNIRFQEVKSLRTFYCCLETKFSWRTGQNSEVRFLLIFTKNFKNMFSPQVVLMWKETWLGLKVCTQLMRSMRSCSMSLLCCHSPTMTNSRWLHFMTLFNSFNGLI